MTFKNSIESSSYTLISEFAKIGLRVGIGTKEYITDDLDNCLSLDTNMDQTSRSFFQDVVLSMLDEGCVAIIPTDTSKNPATDAYKIYTMRTGKIVTWYPDKVRVNVYNERTRT